MKISDLLEYFSSQASIRATGQGVAETSYYGSLEALLNTAGAGLKPTASTVILSSTSTATSSGHAQLEQIAYDHARTQALQTLEIRELRFWNSEVSENLEGVLEAIWSQLHQEHQQPLA